MAGFTMTEKLRFLCRFSLIVLFFSLVGCDFSASSTASPLPAQTLSVAVNPTQAGSNGPHIVGQNPMNGERLGLRSAIQIVFDRDMDPAKTIAAWTFSDSTGAPVEGVASWKDARTFIFTPQAKLQASAVYLAVFSATATGADGQPLTAAINLSFHTTDALVVGQVFPADKAADVDANANITVIFNRPVVPLLITEEQDKLPQPLKFTPDLPGHGEWVNSSVYVFQPSETLRSGTQYVAQVPAGLTDATGNALEADYSWRFQTRVPQIGHFSLKNGLQDPGTSIENVLLDQAFIVEFLQPMDPESVAKALTLANRETGQPFPTRLNWNKDFTQLTIEPVGRYTIGNFYTLSLDKSAQSRNPGETHGSGAGLKEGLDIRFSTVPLPGIEKVSPAPGSQASDFKAWFSIDFKSPMNFASLKSKIKVSPEPAKELNFYYDQYAWRLTVFGLRPSTEYIVRVLPGMADIYGNTIKTEYSFSFTTAHPAARAQMLLPWTPLVYRDKGPREFFFSYTYLDSASFVLYRLSFDEFKAWQQSDDRLRSAPGVTVIREWKPEISRLNDQSRIIRVPLDDGQGNALPPGYYFIGLKTLPANYDTLFAQGAVFVIATDNITLKTTRTEALAWVVDLEKGQPVANLGVKVYDQYYNQIGTGKTDEKGLVYINGLTDPYMARVDDGEHVAFASSDWGSGVSTNDFGIWQNYYVGEKDAPFAYVYTERPLYRPGQDVFFKGIVRTNDDLHYSLPTQSTVHVTIQRDDEKVYEKDLELSALGSFSGSFKLGDEAALGTYTILLRNAPEANVFSSQSFRVAEYHKPEFQVDASASAADLLVGDSFDFKVDASYYSGGSVGGAGVDWFTEAQPYYFQPGSKYGQYSFMDWDRDTYWSQPQVNGDGTIAEGQGVTDPTGHLDISQLASLGKSKVSQVLSFSANVTDVAGSLVGGSTSVVVHQTKVYAGIRSVNYIGKQGEEQAFDLVTLEWDGNPVPGQAVTVDFVQRQWYSVQQQNEQGNLRWVTSVKEIPVKRNVRLVTDKDGQARISFIPPEGGVYKATVTISDGKGHSQQASAYLWVSSEKYISWRQTNDRSFNLIADKDSYAPGDTAQIMIAQPFQGDVYALVTYERGHIYEKKVILLNGNSTIYQLPVTADMAPAVYVSVVVVSGAENSKSPDFKVGLTRIKVDTSAQSLDVSVTTDKKSAGPGDEVTYTVETRDQKGNPAPAEISLAVVDKAVLALAPSNSDPILSAFYSDQGLGVATALGIVLSAEDFNAQYQEIVNDGESAGGGDKGGDDLGIVTVRQDFKDTAFFTGQVMTDQNGRAQVKVKLPENLTTWRVDVRAVTADSRVGQVTGELLSTKPLFIEMQTPRFFVVGDQARVGAVIHNNSTNDLKVSVSLDAQGVDLKSASAQQVDVAARQQAYVTWDVTVKPDAIRVDFTAHATSGSFSDASKPALGTLPGQGIPVYAYNVPETVGTAGLIRDENSVTEAIQLPQSMGFGNDTLLSVEVSPSLAASLKDGLTYLKDYPYYCIEQTISSFLPNVISSRALKLAGAPSITLQTTLDSNVSTALQRIYAKQNSDGGWSWWDGSQSDPLTSAYVVLGLQEAQSAGYMISADVFTRAIDFLKNNLPALDANDSQWQYNREAFIIYVLARANQYPATGFIYDHRSSLSLYGKAYLAQALYDIDPKDKRIPTLMSDLNSAAVLSAAGAHWEEGYTDYWNWNTDLRTTAIVLGAYVRIDPQNPLTANAVRWLMSSRTGDHWASTQETAWTLMSLTDWLVASKEYDTSYQYAVGLNGKKLQDGTASKDNLTETLKLKVALKDLLADQANYLVFARGAGTGNLYYSAYLTATLPVESVQPLDQGVIISRQYFGIDDPKKPITQATRGDLVRVRLTMVIPDAVHYIVVNDALPAGLEAVDTSIATDTQVPEVYTLQDFDTRGWGWWYFSHIELRDEKVVLSTDYLPAGTYVYTYLARASSAGTFKVIPPTAAEFYFPDVGGRGAGSTFTVK